MRNRAHSRGHPLPTDAVSSLSLGFPPPYRGRENKHMAQKIRIIGVPMDLGASRRGVDMGPSALRVAGLQSRLKQLGCQVEDIGNIAVRQPEEQHYGEKNAKYLDEITETCRGLAEMVCKALDEDMVPLVLGGDHSIALGTAAGGAAHFHKK